MKFNQTATIFAILAVVAVIGTVQTASATRDDYGDETSYVKVTLKGVVSSVGDLQVQIIPGLGDTKTRDINPFEHGREGTVEIKPFAFSDEDLANGDKVQVCVFELEHDNIYVCDTKVVEDNEVEVTLRLPGTQEQDATIDQSQFTYYDENGSELPATVQEDSNNVKQGSDSENTQKDQGAGVTVNIGDGSDNNDVTVDQKTTMADVVKEYIPKVVGAAKNTVHNLLD